MHPWEVSIDKRAEDPDRLHAALSDLVKMYQFRSRDEHLSYGVTVSEAYCLRALWRNGRMSMGALADDLALKVSTMTGVVDQLVKKAFVRRVGDPDDRRVQLVELTGKGLKTYEASNEKFQAHLERVMEDKNMEEREMFIEFLEELTEVIADWRETENG